MAAQLKVNIFKLKSVELMSYAKRLAAYERRVQVEFVKTLGEIDRRDSYRDGGHANLFRYLVDELKFSESCAAQRKNVCRAARKFPELYKLLEEGRVSMTTVSKIAVALLGDNRRDLIAKITDKSCRDIELILASDRKVDHVTRDQIRAVGVVKKNSERQGQQQTGLQPSLSLDALEPTREQAPSDQDILVKINFSTTQQVNKKLTRAKELLARKHPQGQLSDILEELLDSYLAKHDPLAKPVKPVKPKGQPSTKKPQPQHTDTCNEGGPTAIESCTAYSNAAQRWAV